MAEFKPIGRVHTPYKDVKPPRQFIYAEEGDYSLEVFDEYVEGLMHLDEHEYIIVLYHADRPQRELRMVVTAPWDKTKTRGVFASRSPVRPNPINMCVARIKSIDGRIIHTSGLDAMDGSPLLDIKPYVPKLDRIPPGEE